jgi:hypothetical protein
MVDLLVALRILSSTMGKKAPRKARKVALVTGGAQAGRELEQLSLADRNRRIAVNLTGRRNDPEDDLRLKG